MLNKTVATTYRNFLNSSALLSKAVAPMLKDGKLSAQHVKDFALEHAHFYECSYLIRTSGTVAFFRNEEDTSSKGIHAAAKKAWQRGIGRFVATASKRGGARNKKEQATAAEKLAASYEKLSAVERKKFRALIGAVV